MADLAWHSKPETPRDSPEPGKSLWRNEKTNTNLITGLKIDTFFDKTIYYKNIFS